jgi:uncharacterized protein (DUF1501 family)
MNNRRTFMQASLGSTALIAMSAHVPSILLGASREVKQGKGERILVVVQLSGGNDGLNTVIPFGDDEYYKNRFTLAINKDAVLKIDDHVALHPSMSDCAKLLEKQQLAIVQGVGYPNPNRSHFESMDLWHTAHGKSDGIQTGWLGRSIESKFANVSMPAIHLGQQQQPLALATRSTPVPSIRSLDQFKLEVSSDPMLARKVQAANQVKRVADNPLLGYLHESNTVALSASKRLGEVLDNTKKDNFPKTDLGQKLRGVAQLIGADIPSRIYYVTLDGFDTHANQLQAHAGLLSEFSNAIGAFFTEMKSQGNDQRVALMSFSEFGRRVRENASRGTDHGTAGPMFVVGSAVKAGLLGKYPSLSDLESGDLKHTVDYRSVYASILEQWLSVDPKKVLGGEHETLKLFA